MLVSCSLNPGGHIAPSAGPVAVSEIDLFAKRAVEDRLAAGDLPGMEMLAGSKRIVMRREMPLAELELGPAARPEIAGLELNLVPQVALQEKADRMGIEVFFVRVDTPEITGDTATILLGTDFAAPRGSGPYLCCCTGKARYRRTHLGWTFEEWMSEWCS